MATKQEEQDEEMKSMGFFLVGDYYYDSQTLKEWVNFIAQDGGETRQITAYEKDGMTVKKNWYDFTGNKNRKGGLQ